MRSELDSVSGHSTSQRNRKSTNLDIIHITNREKSIIIFELQSRRDLDATCLVDERRVERTDELRVGNASVGDQEEIGLDRFTSSEIELPKSNNLLAPVARETGEHQSRTHRLFLNRTRLESLCIEFRLENDLNPRRFQLRFQTRTEFRIVPGREQSSS